MDKTILIEQCRQGDRAAFGKLYTCYAPRMMRVIRRFVSDPTAAEDILHDGFVVVFTHIGQLKDATKIEQWMGSIMRNLSLQYLQQIDITTELNEEGDFEDCPEPEALLTYEELQTIIERLPDGYKTIFRLSVLEGKSHKEIAELLGIAPHTASSQLYHARVLLRKLIAEHLATIAVILLLLIPVGTLLYLQYGTEGDEVAETAPVAIVNDSVVGTHAGASYGRTKKERAFKTQLRLLSPDKRGSRRGLDQDASLQVNEDMSNDNVIAQTDTISTDTTCIATPPATEKLTELPEPLLAYTPTTKKKAQWTVGARFSTSGTPGNPATDDLIYSAADPVAPGTVVPPSTETETEEDSHHDAPLTIGLRIGRPLTQRLSIETGMDFTYLHSQFSYKGGGINLEQQIKAYYLGIPLKLNYQFLNSPRWNVYGTAGIGIEIPVKSSLQTDDRSTKTHDYGVKDFHAPWQGSLSVGIGLQYNLTPHVGIYMEPSVQHHFGGTSTLPTTWQKQPTTFTLPIGLRLNW